MFLRDGFEETTVNDIANAVGVAERTVFRYFPTKVDMIWSEFEVTLDRLRIALASTSPEEPVWESVTRAVIVSNQYPEDELPYVHARMSLIASEPSIHNQSSPWRETWVGIISEFLGERLDEASDSVRIRSMAYAGYGAASAAFDAWVAKPGDSLIEDLRESFDLLGQGFLTAQLANLN